VIVYNKHGKINQQWDIIYADEWKGDPKKGEMNEDFGLKVETDFYVVSQLSSHRYLDVAWRNSNDLVIKVESQRRSQLWYFDQKTLTIKNRERNASWDIKSSGRSSDMQIYSTNSGWW